MLDQTCFLHESISCELRTPVVKLPQLTLDRMLDFVKTSRKEVSDAFLSFVKENNKVFTSAALSSYKEEIDKDFIYSDLGPLEIYVPSIMVKKPVALEYSKMILESLETAETVMEISASEAVKVIDRFISRPKELKDFGINPTIPETMIEIDNRIDKLNEINTNLVDLKNTQDRRRFKDVYLRLTDYHATVANAHSIHELFWKLSVKLDVFKAQVDHINDRVNKLLALINTDENYAMGSVAASKIINVCYQFAREAEFVGKTMNNANIYLKSIRDTNLVVERFVRKNAKPE